MSLTSGISSASPSLNARNVAAETSSAAQAEQKSTLNSLVQKYTSILYRDASSPELKGLSTQITQVAKALGQIVELPHVISSNGVQGVTNLPGTSTGNIDLKA